MGQLRAEGAAGKPPEGAGRARSTTPSPTWSREQTSEGGGYGQSRSKGDPESPVPAQRRGDQPRPATGSRTAAGFLHRIENAAASRPVTPGTASGTIA